VLGSKVSPKEKVGATSVSSALEIALHRAGEVILGSAVALLMSWIMSKIWVVNPEYEERHTGRNDT
jgi:hypothetical protein